MSFIYVVGPNIL